jgi:hypothetical protein
MTGMTWLVYTQISPSHIWTTLYFITDYSWQDIKGGQTDGRNRRQAERGLSNISENSLIHSRSHPKPTVHFGLIFCVQSAHYNPYTYAGENRVTKEGDGNPHQTAWCPILPYFLAYKTNPDFFIRNFRKNNDDCILILVISWKKPGLLHTKIINHNIFIQHRNPENHCHCH